MCVSKGYLKDRHQTKVCLAFVIYYWLCISFFFVCVNRAKRIPKKKSWKLFGCLMMMARGKYPSKTSRELPRSWVKTWQMKSCRCFESLINNPAHQPMTSLYICLLLQLIDPSLFYILYIIILMGAVSALCRLMSGYCSYIFLWAVYVNMQQPINPMQEVINYGRNYCLQGHIDFPTCQLQHRSTIRMRRGASTRFTEHFRIVMQHFYSVDGTSVSL